MGDFIPPEICPVCGAEKVGDVYTLQGHEERQRYRCENYHPNVDGHHYGYVNNLGHVLCLQGMNALIYLKAKVAPASEQMRKDARTGRAIETLRNKYGNSTIEFYHGVVTIQEIRDDDVYIRLGEGDSIDEALFYAGLLPTEDTQDADHV